MFWITKCEILITFCLNMTTIHDVGGTKLNLRPAKKNPWQRENSKCVDRIDFIYL